MLRPSSLILVDLESALFWQPRARSLYTMNLDTANEILAQIY